MVVLADGGRDALRQEALEAAEDAGTIVHVAADDEQAAAQVVAEADLVLDGIVGIGGRPGLRPAPPASSTPSTTTPGSSLSTSPSGLDPSGETGEDDAVWADETVTFSTAKPAHLLPAGEAATGRLTVVDIGLDLSDAVRRGRAARLRRRRAALAGAGRRRRQVLPWRARRRGRQRGLPRGRRLTTTAAAEAGVGMLRYVGSPTPVGLVHAAVPEAVVGTGRVQAWAVGPGSAR